MYTGGLRYISYLERSDGDTQLQNCSHLGFCKVIAVLKPVSHALLQLQSEEGHTL